MRTNHDNSFLKKIIFLSIVHWMGIVITGFVSLLVYQQNWKVHLLFIFISAFYGSYLFLKENNSLKIYYRSDKDALTRNFLRLELIFSFVNFLLGSFILAMAIYRITVEKTPLFD